jgi:DNA-directed RNA polymerase subunit RPC12/RpoP
MKCPNCSTNLLRKQRTSSRCGSCGKEFALDPKTNPLLLHDLRVRTLAGKLSDGGRLRYTAGQLLHASSRKPLRQPAGSVGCFAVLGGILTVTGAIVLVSGGAGGVGAIALGAGALFLLGGVVRFRSRKNVTLPMSAPRFRGDVLERWQGVYGADPSGMVREDRFVDPDPPARPRVAVLCPDPSAGMCLVANGFPRRFDAAVAGDIRALPAGVPVVILHDASVPGCRFAMRTRQTLAGRPAVIAGLRPSMVLSAKGALRLRSRSIDREALDELRGWLTGEELAWLGEGWWVPLASVPPAKLLTATARAVRRALPGDRDQRRAERVGFLSWPGS